MSEGLDALNTLKVDLFDHLLSETTINTLYQIIEKELKEGEKNKKVLEIIKEKGIDVGYLVNVFKWNNSPDTKQENKITDNTIMFLAPKIPGKILTEQELELLKEELTHEIH